MNHEIPFWLGVIAQMPVVKWIPEQCWLCNESHPLALIQRPKGRWYHLHPEVRRKADRNPVPWALGIHNDAAAEEHVMDEVWRQEFAQLPANRPSHLRLVSEESTR
jgi:hypothetical protein